MGFGGTGVQVLVGSKEGKCRWRGLEEYAFVNHVPRRSVSVSDNVNCITRSVVLSHCVNFHVILLTADS